MTATVTTEAPKPGLARLLRKLGPLAGLACVFTLFACLRPDTFLSADNLQIMVLQTAVVGTAALGMTLVIASGGIDLSVGSVIALTTVSIATALSAGTHAAVAIAAGIGTGSLCGLVTGLLVTRLKLSPFIATLGMWGAVRGAAKGLAGEQMVVPPTTWLNQLLTPLPDDLQWLLLPPGVWLLLLLAVMVAALLRYTKLGLHIFAIGSNEETARLCGVGVEKTKLLVYLLGSGLAGVAGLLQFSYLTVGDPTTAAGLELDVIAAVVIGGGSLSGGEGSVPGSLVGAFIMTVVANGCTKLGVPNWVQEIVTAGMIVGAVTLDRLRHRSRG